MSLITSESARKNLDFYSFFRQFVNYNIFAKLPVPCDRAKRGKTGGGSKVFAKVIQCDYHIWE